MRYVVRLMPDIPERVKNVELLKSIIPKLEIVEDKCHDGYETFFRMCELINDTGAVTLEDDVILCKNFVERVEFAITILGKQNVISFFEKPKTYFKTGYVGGSNFFSLLCVYFPHNFGEKLINNYKQFCADRPQKASGFGTDNLVSYVLVKEKMRYWRVRPTLVQHHAFKSSIGNRSTHRQTLYFIDDMENNND